MHLFKRSRFALQVALGFLMAVAVAPFVIHAPYIFCCLRESAWLSARDEAELDRRMVAFYRKQVIRPEQSAWGSAYVLQPGERMVRYLVLYCEPLDVVFDRDRRMVAAFTTYE